MGKKRARESGKKIEKTHNKELRNLVTKRYYLSEKIREDKIDGAYR
jgi:hypothetical protein